MTANVGSSPFSFRQIISYMTPNWVSEIGRIVSTRLLQVASCFFSLKRRTITQEKPGIFLKEPLAFRNAFPQRKRVDPTLCGERLLKKGPKAWAEKVIQHYGVAKGKNCYQIKIKLDLPFFIDTVEGPLFGHTYYGELQKQIAELKKGEDDSQKPSIDLKLVGKNTSAKEVSEFAILGGVGCLADADLLERTMRKLIANKAPLNQIKISLYSNPPPREISEAVNAPSFINRMVKFIRKPHKRFYIASNTAHVNFKTLNRLGNHLGVNMVQKIAETIQKTPDPHVLVLGTTQAKRAALYPKQLTALGVDHHTTNEKEQMVLQEEINKQKHNTIQDEGTRLLIAIKKIVSRVRSSGGQVNQILLGCTELPAILKNQLQKLENELHVKVIDSQEEFAQMIANECII